MTWYREARWLGRGTLLPLLQEDSNSDGGDHIQDQPPLGFTENGHGNNLEHRLRRPTPLFR